MFNKSFNISNSISINFLLLEDSTRFLILQNNLKIKKYIKIPNFIIVSLQNKILQFQYTEKTLASKFFRNFFKVYQDLKYKIFETIMIRGVGLKVTLLEEPLATLELKLGYSHRILLPVPENLNVIIKKKKLLVEGLDKVAVGNFANKIINYKFINNYTGKGLWLKSYNKFVLKEIKKI